MDITGTVKSASTRLYNLDLSAVGESVAKAAKAARNGAQGLFWGVMSELTDAWGTAMCWLLLPGEKLGLWKLRRANEGKGAPHMTRRLAVLIQAVALTIEGIAIICAAYKLVMLYRFGKA